MVNAKLSYNIVVRCLGVGEVRLGQGSEDECDGDDQQRSVEDELVRGVVFSFFGVKPITRKVSILATHLLIPEIKVHSISCNLHYSLSSFLSS